MIKTYIANFQKSRAIRQAFYKKLGGLVVVIAANLNYFEGLVSETTFAIITGVVAILVGLNDQRIRATTTKALSEK